MKTYYELSVTEQDIHRFWKKVNQDGAAPDVNDALVTAPSTACWEWHAARQSNGYGRFFVGGNVAFAHRVAYVIANGPIPRQMVVDHLCRNHACVNPEHLRALTFRENLLVGDTFTARHAAVTRCPQGHEYTEANTYVSRRGQRSCRPCNRIKSRELRARRKAVSDALDAGG